MARRETANATPSGARLIEYDELGSTSAEARRRFERGERGPLWILALQQTDGYGRRGRSWRQRPGDLAATFLSRAPGPRARIGELSFVAALSVYEALERVCDAARLSLKWPNDVLLDGGKVGGLLLELLEDPAHPVISFGVGLNIKSKPPSSETPYPTARLEDAIDPSRKLPEPRDIMTAIDGHFLNLCALWVKQGFSPIREAWLARAHGVGSELVVNAPQGTLTGSFEGIDGTGRLILNRPTGEVVRIDAGDVMFAGRDGASPEPAEEEA
ncbi:MAG: biotin--[acetyl-CoA-carboxylase] ligase [Pseudomonadota bacterium]